jgi:hypothetical protein
MFYNAEGQGDKWWWVWFALLTALAVLIAGTTWTRRLRPSMTETFGVLLAVELIALGIVAALEGGLSGATFDVWAVVSVLFAPWWLAAFWIGGGTDVS